MIYHTPNGEIVREILILQREGKEIAEMKANLIEKHGENFKEFIEILLED